MAGFVPEHDDFQALVYRIASQVSLTFADAETRLLAEIARRLIRDLPERPELAAQLNVIRSLERTASELTAGITREWAETVIARAATDGAATVAADQIPRIPTISALADQHVIAASLVAWDLGNAFEEVKARILRYPRDTLGQFLLGGDVYQDVIAANAPQVLLGASTASARKAALIEFLERGVTCFTDIRGRNWRIGTYTEMATRTAVARAYTDAKVYRAAQLGIDLFSILGGRNACDHCAPWFGKIIASSGSAGLRLVPHAFEDRLIEVDVAGTLADWRESGAGHPNCMCQPVEYLPGLRIPVAASGYDPAAHAARDRLRGLEVSERDAKRKLAIATAAGDRDRALKQHRRVLAIQKTTREHVSSTGQRRRYERAQVRFADGSRYSPR